MKYFEALAELTKEQESNYFKPVIFRSGWNGSHQFVGLCDNWNGNFITNNEEFKIAPFTYIKTTQNNIVAWVPSQSDQLAEDWEVLLVDVTPKDNDNEVFINDDLVEEIDSETLAQERNKEAYQVIKENVQKDLDLAWSWHSMVAMSFVDEGGSHEVGNKAAVRFMQMAFEVDTSKHKGYQYNDISEEKANELLEAYLELHPEAERAILPSESNLLEPTTQDLGDVCPSHVES